MVQWKHEGEQDKFIVKLIKDGKIHKDTKPAFLKATYPAVFGAFTINVIRNHLNVLKRAAGIFLEQLDEDDAADVECAQQDPAEHKGSDKSQTAEPTSIDLNDICNQKNYPILCDVYKDPDTQCEKVILAFSLPGGVKNVRLEINDDGSVVTIKYDWPETSFNVLDLFKQKLEAKELQNYHPMILSLQSSLENVRSRIDLSPETNVDIKLPIAVQSTPDSYAKWGVKRANGTLILVATFTGYMKIYSKKVADATVDF